jgi:hypothetical protein
MKSNGLDVCMKGKGKVGEEHNHRRSGENKSIDPGMLQEWKPPPPGWVKMNTDAAFCLNSGTASTGIVVRDAEGKVMLTAWQVLRDCNSPEVAEAEAYLQGLRLTAQWICQPTIAETDCLSLVKMIKETKDERSCLSGLLKEARAVANMLPECT